MNIRSGIPIPPKGRAGGRRNGSLFTDTIRLLQVGQSVIVDSEKKLDHARHVIRGMGWRYEQRKGPEGWEVWRTA